MQGKIKKFIIPLPTLMRLRALYRGKRHVLADEIGVHYNTICKVLEGTHFNKKVLEALKNRVKDADNEVFALQDVRNLEKVIAKFEAAEQQAA